MALTAKVFIVSPEQGPVWDMEPGRPTTFKLLSEQTRGSISVFEELVPVGAGTPLHIHRTSDETIHLMAGELKIKLGTQVTTIGAGTWVFIPRDTAHGWKNCGQEPVRAAFMFSPADGGRFFEELRLLSPADSKHRPGDVGGAVQTPWLRACFV